MQGSRQFCGRFWVFISHMGLHHGTATAAMKENTNHLSREVVEILYMGEKYSITQGLQGKNIEMKIQCVCKS